MLTHTIHNIERRCTDYTFSLGNVCMHPKAKQAIHLVMNGIRNYLDTTKCSLDNKVNMNQAGHEENCKWPLVTIRLHIPCNIALYFSYCDYFLSV